jgi:23S rRNA (uracil1939-C5)-methyltransferase
VPPCPHVARGCGGCGWQHVATDAQAQIKRDVVLEALTRTGGLVGAQVHLAAPLPTTGFRTTLRVAVDGSRPPETPGRHAAGRPQPGRLPTEPARVGFRMHHQHDVVVVDDCLVAHPRLAELLPAMRVTGAAEVVLRCSPATGERLAFADEAGARIDGLPADVSIGSKAKLHEVVAGVTLQVSAGSFFQSRTDGAEALVAAVREAAGPMPQGRTIDAYGGVGLFAATVLTETEVVVIESSPSSVLDALHNLAGRAATVERVTVERWQPRRADLVIADPARRGLGKEAVDVLAATHAPRLVLVSCDPVSLARDAKLLAAHGFRHERTTLIDLFPHTAHIEAVTAFSRG